MMFAKHLIIIASTASACGVGAVIARDGFWKKEALQGGAVFYRDIAVRARVCDAAGFSGCIGKIIKMISLYWVMNRGLIELGSKNPGQFGKRD